ncbi:hypothetical protein [Rickettsiella endosymbiont of Dermanyssus gallinae]|uniref:hypothetical protein n=1 Tax=Rickettsiella endosymbiont of Dermanyssus gallinae TaxID=2856608 RepID=UPI001C52FF47|nr:hypothetical protein [Rickettsiella endosymbiont of Dermanyssus gallinae]
MESNEGQTTEHVSESTGQHLPENPAAAEKHLPQSAINRIVVEAKRDAYEQGIKVGKASTIAPIEATPPSTSSNLTIEQVQKIIDENEARQAKARYEQQAQQASQDFLGKLKSGEEKYSDFNETIHSVNWTSIPHVLDLANQTDETAAVVYELAKTPQKAITLWQLYQVNPKAALAETKKIAESIKQNQRQHPSTRPPLSPLTPSVTRMSNGPLTVRELKEDPRFIF